MLAILYIVFSIGAFLVTALPVYLTHRNYFTSLAILTSQDVGSGILYNMMIALALLFYKFVESVVFGGIKEDEAEVIHPVT